MDLNQTGPHELAPAAPPSRPFAVWVALVGLAVAVVVMVSIAIIVFRPLVSVARPLFAVARAINAEFPGSNPQATIMWANGRKVFRVAASGGFNPTRDSKSAEQMSSRIAQIVRENWDLDGFDGIVVVLQQRVSIGVVTASTNRVFQFPVASSNSATPRARGETESTDSKIESRFEDDSN
jgi:hypothetical protein